MMTAQPTRQVRRSLARKNRQPQEQPDQRLVQDILQQGELEAAAATAAASLTQAGLSDAELQAWRQDLEARLQVIQQHPEQNLGHIEEELVLLC